MKIVADENIPFVKEAFKNIGEVSTYAGRDMSPDKVKDAEVLLVRSITKVNEKLLSGSKVRFVGTATIGVDHIDTDYLTKNNIAFSSAPGSNAESVAQYVTSVLLNLLKAKCEEISGKTIGVVGVGNTGSRVARNAEAMGMNVLLNDPPLERRTGDPKYLPINDLFEADFISLHVPLTKEGIDATYHLVDEDFLGKMKSGSVLINSSRGAVVDNKVLLSALKNKTISDSVLDVWENEPDISIELLNSVEIGTPHIAGYSYDGKVRGTEMLYSALCDFLDVEKIWDPEVLMPKPDVPSLKINISDKSETEILFEAVTAVYDVKGDDKNLRKTVDLSQEERKLYFDKLRKQYPIRREFDKTKVILDPPDEKLKEIFNVLKFQ